MTANRRYVGTASGKAHILQPPHFRATYCGRRDEVKLPVAKPSNGEACQRCVAKAERDEEFKSKLREGMADANRHAEANRQGRFHVYRCTLCGAQHHPQGRGSAFCYAEGHIAELEILEVTGPTFSRPRAAA